MRASRSPLVDWRTRFKDFYSVFVVYGLIDGEPDFTEAASTDAAAELVLIQPSTGQ